MRDHIACEDVDGVVHSGDDDHKYHDDEADAVEKSQGFWANLREIQDAEDHVACMATIEIVTGLAIWHHQARQGRLIPEVTLRKWELKCFLNELKLTRKKALIP